MLAADCGPYSLYLHTTARNAANQSYSETGTFIEIEYFNFDCLYIYGNVQRYAQVWY